MSVVSSSKKAKIINKTKSFVKSRIKHMLVVALIYVLFILFIAFVLFLIHLHGRVADSVTLPQEAKSALSAPESASVASPSPKSESLPPPAVTVEDAAALFLENVEKAKNKKDAVSLYLLAEVYENGSTAISVDFDKAADLYDMSAGLGYDLAQYKMGLIYSESKDYESQSLALSHFAKAADQGYAPAQLELANILLENALGDSDYAEAFALYKAAADQGLPSAQLNLGLMYHKGVGVNPDPSKAIEYYTLAAKSGQAQAQYNLGVSYYVGYGVEKDVFKAKEWLGEALKNGNSNSLIILEEINIL